MTLFRWRLKNLNLNSHREILIKTTIILILLGIISLIKIVSLIIKLQLLFISQMALTILKDIRLQHNHYHVLQTIDYLLNKGTQLIIQHNIIQCSPISQVLLAHALNSKYLILLRIRKCSQ